MSEGRTRLVWSIRLAAVFLTLCGNQLLIVAALLFVLPYSSPLGDWLVRYSPSMLEIPTYALTAWVLFRLSSIWRTRAIRIGMWLACLLDADAVFGGSMAIFEATGHVDAFPTASLGMRGLLIWSAGVTAVELTFLIPLAWACFWLARRTRRVWSMRLCGTMCVAWGALESVQLGATIAEAAGFRTPYALSGFWRWSNRCEIALGLLSWIACVAVIRAARWLSVNAEVEGRCPVCLYDLGDDRARGCPECGWDRSSTGEIAHQA